MSELAILATDTAMLDRSGDPATFVVLACERAKDWLNQAVEHGEIDQIVELKSQAEAIRIYTTQKQLGKDAELAAAEIVRRAERGLGVCIRRGQEAGVVRRQGVTDYRPGQHIAVSNLVSPAVVIPNTNERTAIYEVTDNVTDEQFEEAIAEAKDEGNLSRANVVRKVKPDNASASWEPEKRVATKARPEHLRRLRHIDPNRVVEQTILGSGISADVAEQIDFGALDRDRLEGWVSSLSDVIRSLTTLRNNLKKELAQ